MFSLWVFILKDLNLQAASGTAVVQKLMTIGSATSSAATMIDQQALYGKCPKTVLIAVDVAERRLQHFCIFSPIVETDHSSESFIDETTAEYGEGPRNRDIGGHFA